MPIFDLIGREGAVPRAELERTFNMGIGMVAVLPPASVDPAIELLRGLGVKSWTCGEVRGRREGEEGDAAAKGVDGGAVRLVGEHPSR
jgi:phosphoribosylformylglycinamidine cyclo-ligase